MYNNLSRIILCIAAIIVVQVLHAQEIVIYAPTEENKQQEKEIAIEDIQLPPLAVFLESVYEHPSTRLYKTYKDEEESNLTVIKREWLNYVKGIGSYQYGKTNALMLDSDVIGNTFNYSDQTRAYYYIGVGVSIPIGDLTSRKSKIKAQEARIDRVQYEYEIALEQRKLLILEAYNQVTQQLAVLKAKSDAAALYNAQMKLSEQDYIKGKISVMELSLERARRSNAVVAYEEGRTALKNAITLLEMLTNVRIAQ